MQVEAESHTKSLLLDLNQFISNISTGLHLLVGYKWQTKVYHANFENNMHVLYKAMPVRQSRLCLCCIVLLSVQSVFLGLQ